MSIEDDVKKAVRAPRHFSNTGVFDALDEIKPDLPAGWEVSHGHIEEGAESFCVTIGSVRVRPSDGAYQIYAYKQKEMAAFQQEKSDQRKKAEQAKEQEANEARKRASL